ncbi:MAG: 30S ribosomal protein S17 [Patescibacteria group bacterium]
MRHLQGIVVSDKMQKTVVVQIVHRITHAKYGKTWEKNLRFKAHDPEGSAKMGDAVVIEETRPLSREKRWKVVEVIKKVERVESEK